MIDYNWANTEHLKSSSSNVTFEFLMHLDIEI